MNSMFINGIIHTQSQKEYLILNSTAKKNNVNLIKTQTVPELFSKVEQINPTFIIINDDTLLDSTLMCGISDLTDKVEILITNRYGQTATRQISYPNLIKYIKEISNRYSMENSIRNNNLIEITEEKIEKLEEYFDCLGFLSHFEGTTYLKDIILMLIKSNVKFENMSNVCYPAIAVKYGKSISTIERSIRFSIDKAWNNVGNEVWKNFFKTSGKKIDDNYRPSIKQFIFLILDKF